MAQGSWTFNSRDGRWLLGESFYRLTHPDGKRIVKGRRVTRFSFPTECHEKLPETILFHHAYRHPLCAHIDCNDPDRLDRVRRNSCASKLTPSVAFVST